MYSKHAYTAKRPTPNLTDNYMKSNRTTNHEPGHFIGTACESSDSSYDWHLNTLNGNEYGGVIH